MIYTNKDAWRPEMLQTIIEKDVKDFLFCRELK
jgi:hypothetical protein